MKTNSLIPPLWNIKACNWDQLVFLGSENLSAMRAFWRTRERDLGSRIKWIQEVLDALVNGPEVYGKSATFRMCGDCAHAKLTSNTCRCELMARISRNCHFKEYSSCKFFGECPDKNKKLVASLKKEREDILRCKKQIAENIAQLSKAIEAADHKPPFSFLRSKDHFAPVDDAIVFLDRNGKIEPCHVDLSNKFKDYDEMGYISFTPKVIDLKMLRPYPTTRAVIIKSPQIVTLDEYHYFLENHEYGRIWIESIDDRWLKENISNALSSIW